MPSATLPFYLYPVGGYTFGEITTQGTRHDGIDLGTPIGTPLSDVLPGSATVTKAGFFPWGGEVDITGKTKSGQSFTEVLAHLDRLFVTQGQSVTQGTVVGLSGGEGLPAQYSTGPHTHLGFFEGGQAVNPSTVLNALGLGTAASNGVTQAGTTGSGGTTGPDNGQNNPLIGAIPFGEGPVLQGILGAFSNPVADVLGTLQADLERTGFFILALMIILFGGLVLFWPGIKDAGGKAARAAEVAL